MLIACRHGLPKQVPVKKVAAKKAAKKIESDDEDEESAVSTEESDAVRLYLPLFITFIPVDLTISYYTCIATLAYAEEEEGERSILILFLRPCC